MSHVCLNDNVVEGLELRDDDGRLKSFSVQYHPEARPDRTTRRTCSTGSAT